jgi:ABC-type uncharacterized transport system auxiliary subunit
MKTSRILVVAWLSFALGGCALLSKGEVSMPRYYSPDLPLLAPNSSPKSSGVELRLGRVTAGSYLGEKIVFRQTAYEVGFYEDRLWTERPVAYLRRALTRVLYEEEGLGSILSGPGPSLDVELESFEEVRQPKHLALVRIAFTLRDERVVRLQQTLTFEKPIAETHASLLPDAVAAALGSALRDAVYDVTGRVLAKLAEAPTEPRNAKN